MSKNKGIKTFLCLFLSAAMLLPAQNTAAASMKKAKVLKTGKTYEYDLDGDGKKETISYTTKGVEKKDSYKVRYVITINGKEAYNSLENDHGNICVADVNTKDKTMELFLMPDYETGIGGTSSYLRYQKGKITKVQDLLKTYTKQKYNVALGIHAGDDAYLYTDGKGKIEFLLCMQTKAVGYVHAHTQMKWSKGKFTDSLNGKFLLKNTRDCDLSFVKKSFPVYKTAGGKTVAFRTKKGAQLKYQGIAFKNKKGYLQCEYKGKTGWFGMNQFDNYKYMELDGTAHA